MAILDKIKATRKQAMLDGSKAVKDTLTTLMGEIETDAKRSGKPATDADVIAKIKKFIKGIDETLPLVGQDSEKGLALIMEKEYLQAFLPQQLTEEELTAVIYGYVANGADNIGAIMKELKGEYEGQFDGKAASGIAREALF